ncbi:MAG: hypothetical protein E7549_05520 [Ruminococcaceae bacterium]|nr:hypothetical protein [Oscillospiraceae bacterium]
MTKQWCAEQAWAWYNEQPWIRGWCGYPSNCVNRIAMWQEHNHRAVAEQIAYEFALAQKTGYNAVRAVLQFEVWYHQHDSFMANLEEYFTLADKYGIKVMLVLGNDCCVPRALYQPPKFGEQPIDWGYHSGIRRGPHAGGHTEMGYLPIDDAEYTDAHYRMVDEIAAKYAKDPRLQVWNIWNEIGNSRRGMTSVPHMEKYFEIVRSHDPIQPLTAECWLYDDERMPYNPAELRALELSDVISFHCYWPLDRTVQIIENLRETYGRPLLCTEWLHRIGNQGVEEIFPLFYLEKVGCYNWGLMQGFSQTYEPHGCFMEQIADPNYHGTAQLHLWQHDLYRFNGLPYIASEIACIQKFAALADVRWAKQHPENA